MRRDPAGADGQREPARQDQLECTDLETLCSFRPWPLLSQLPSALPLEPEANGSLNFAQSSVNRNDQSTLIVHGDLQLFVDFRHQVLLHQSLALLALLDPLAHLQGHVVVMQLLCLPVQLGRVLRDRMLLVLASSTFLGNLHISSSESLRWPAGTWPSRLWAHLEQHPHCDPVVLSHRTVGRSSGSAAVRIIYILTHI